MSFIGSLFTNKKKSSAGNGQSNSEKAQAAKDKSQHRRAQVRKAQIQHRQRKANYVKSLELDITQYRDMLSRAQAQVKAIETENNSIRSALHGAGAHIPESVREEAAVSDPMVVNAPEGNLSTQFQAQTIQDTQTHEQTLLQQDELSQQQQLQPQLETQQQAGRSPDLFSDIDVNDLTVSLGMDGIMGTPCFHIQSSSSGSSSVSGISTPWTSPEQSAEMTVGQEQLAINFILAYVPLLSPPALALFSVTSLPYVLTWSTLSPAWNIAVGPISPWATFGTIVTLPKMTRITLSWQVAISWLELPKHSTPPAAFSTTRSREARKVSRLNSCSGDKKHLSSGKSPAVESASSLSTAWRSRLIRTTTKLRRSKPGSSLSVVMIWSDWWISRPWTSSRENLSVSSSVWALEPPWRGWPLRAWLRGSWVCPRFLGLLLCFSV